MSLIIEKFLRISEALSDSGFCLAHMPPLQISPEERDELCRFFSPRATRSGLDATRGGWLYGLKWRVDDSEELNSEKAVLEARLANVLDHLDDAIVEIDTLKDELENTEFSVTVFSAAPFRVSWKC